MSNLGFDNSLVIPRNTSSYTPGRSLSYDTTLNRILHGKGNVIERFWTIIAPSCNQGIPYVNPKSHERESQIKLFRHLLTQVLLFSG